MNRYSICKYPMNEAELPAAMERYGFRNVSTGFAAIDLTPDYPGVPAVLAHNMINADRYSALDAID